MNRLVLLIISIHFSFFGFSQVPSIEWQKCFGGSNDEEGNVICRTTDNNVIVGGYTSSNDGDVVTIRRGDSDIWLIKVDLAGNLLWSKTIGGSGSENVKSIIPTYDNGYAIFGSTSSSDFPVSSTNHGMNEMWFVKSDSSCDLQLEKCYGSPDHDYGLKIIQSPDSDFIILGKVQLAGGNISSSSYHNLEDFWVAKVNRVGLIRWSKCLGGFLSDEPSSIVPTNGGYLITGYIGSSDGDVTCLNPTHSAWVVKIDFTGSILWQKCFGGSGADQGIELLSLNDGTFYLCAITTSNDGDVSGLTGISSSWIVKCDSIGNILWQHCYGGSNFNAGFSFCSTFDGGLVVGGVSNSSNINGYHLQNEAYAFKVDSSGNLLWEKCFGGSLMEQINSIIQVRDSGFIFTGYSTSIDGDITLAHGNKDIWLVKLNDRNTGIEESSKEISGFSITKSDNLLQVSFTSLNFEMNLISIYNLTGMLIFSRSFNSLVGYNTMLLPLNINSGFYFIRIENSKTRFTHKFIY